MRPVVREEALVCSGCRVLQSPRLALHRVEAGERRVEVCLIKDFTAIDEIAIDRQEFDRPPFGIETLLRNALCYMGTDGPEVSQPMYSLDAERDIWNERPQGKKRGVEATLFDDLGLDGGRH